MNTYQVTLRIQGIKFKSKQVRVEKFSIGTTNDITIADTILQANRMIVADYQEVVRAELTLVSNTETKRILLK